MSASRPLPTLFIPHGGGPCFFMDWDPPDTWARMGDWLRTVANLVGEKPKAVLVISAHWEAPAFTVTTTWAPDLIYDYYGFPEHTYRLTWPARGAPEVAARAQGLLAAAGLPVAADANRGLDHGVFVPFKLIYPDAQVPVVQLSLRQGLDPAEHIAAGRALAPLRNEGVLIVGSGMSYHNMQRFRRNNKGIDPDSERFDAWLGETVACPQPEREQRLLEWDGAPGAHASHPREEHLMPLHVVASAAGNDAGRRLLADKALGSAQSAFGFGSLRSI